MLQTYTFARDLRTWQMLNEAMDENKDKLSKVTRRVRHVLEAVIEYGGDTRQGVRGRLRDVKEHVDRQ
jgi:hypothetical protein